METQTKKKQVTQKILWAIDPFVADKSVLRSAAWCLNALARAQPSEIHPVYVGSSASSTVDFPKAPEFLESLKEEGRDVLATVLARVKVPRLLPLEVLPGTAITQRGMAEKLVDHAKGIGASLIAVSTHGRKGLNRFFLGSFAETLALLSPVPLLIVHPNWRRTPDFGEIFFPTDFSGASREAFDRVLSFAAARGSRLTLFHKAPAMAIPPFEGGAAYYAAHYRALREELKAREAIAREWAAIARKRGVQAKVAIDRSPLGPLTDAIVSRARKLGAMIAMSSQSGALGAVLLGSTARGVIRASLQPVWVIHPEPKKGEGIRPGMKTKAAAGTSSRGAERPAV